jgi:hypothetical protein
VNVAVTAAAAFIVTVHGPVPVQAPLQPVKAEPALGVAVRVTTVPLTKSAAHVAPQLIPAGLLVTVPVPVPARLTVSANVCGVNVAVTAVAAVRVTTQLPVPLQPPPLQPVNADPALGVAVSVTTVPLTKSAAQVAPQSMPVGLLVTAPLPPPPWVTVSVTVGVKVAATVVFADIVTVHTPVPLQPPPLHPAKVEPAAGVAVSVTTVPLAKVPLQVGPQLIPAGSLMTVPLPAPACVTVSAIP